MIRFAELGIALSSIAAIGIGLWWERPSAALIGVGGIVLSLTVAGRMLGMRRREPDE